MNNSTTRYKNKHRLSSEIRQKKLKLRRFDAIFLKKCQQYRKSILILWSATKVRAKQREMTKATEVVILSILIFLAVNSNSCTDLQNSIQLKIQVHSSYFTNVPGQRNLIKLFFFYRKKQDLRSYCVKFTIFVICLKYFFLWTKNLSCIENL